MNPTSVDAKDILDGESSLGLVYATDLFVGEMPSEPDNCVGLYDTPGEPPNMEDDYLRPGLQVRVRNASYDTGHELLQSILATLKGTANHTENSTRYLLFAPQGSPMFIAWDDNHRALFTGNLRVHRTPA